MATVMQRAAHIALAVFDVDGVLTDGRLYYGPDGEALKAFHSRDGLGLKALAQAGIQVAVISGRSHPAVNVRLEQLGIREVHQGIEHKLPVLHELMQRYQVTPQQTCFTGDDWNDLPCLRVAGLACMPADGSHALQSHADYITRCYGGMGAAREICELILAARQQLQVLHDIGGSYCADTD